MKKVGDTLFYKDELGEDLKLVLAGGLNNSIFQGNILIADTHFKKHFPSVAGSKVMLIDSKAKDRESVAEFLSFYFKDFGIEFTPAAQRLAEFNSVTNTYLNVFMMLGGLGVAIGTLGFGIVLLRNKLERKKELALLMAVGISNQQLFKLVFFEHFIVLAIGLGIGILSALVGFLPSLISPAFNFPGIFVFMWVLIIFLSGLISIAITAKVSNNNQLVDTLRNEIDYA
jgi:ABC-type antimicrobial peptide transport system permease subunit